MGLDRGVAQSLLRDAEATHDAVVAALHRVVRSLRAAYPQRSDLWAAHIHVGA